MHVPIEEDDIPEDAADASSVKYVVSLDGADSRESASSGPESEASAPEEEEGSDD